MNSLTNHHARKVIKVGNSVAISIPPHVLDHLGIELGDWLIWDLNIKHFAVLGRAPVPPYVATSDEPDTPP